MNNTISMMNNNNENMDVGVSVPGLNPNQKMVYNVIQVRNESTLYFFVCIVWIRKHNNICLLNFIALHAKCYINLGL